MAKPTKASLSLLLSSHISSSIPVTPLIEPRSGSELSSASTKRSLDPEVVELESESISVLQLAPSRLDQDVLPDPLSSSELELLDNSERIVSNKGTVEVSCLRQGLRILP
jgi:hypothetical protein